MTKTIRIEDWKDIAQVSIKLSDGPEVALRGPVLRTGIWAAQRPGWGNASGAVDAIILRASGGILVSPSVRALSERDRRRLILALVRLKGVEKDWRSLYGTSLTLDERFLATLVWAQRREIREAQSSLRKMRQRLIEEPPKKLGTATRMSPGLVGLQKQLAAMNSLNRMTKMTPLLSGLKPPVIAGLGPQLGASLGANIGMGPAVAEMIKPSLRSFGLQSPALAQGWVSPAVSAGFKAEMSRITSPMGALSMAKGTKMGFLADDYTSSIAKQIEGMSGLTSFAKQFDSALGRNGFPGLGSAELFKGGLASAFPGFDLTKFGLGGNLGRQTQEMMESLLMAEMARLWGDDPLWFLIGYLNPRRLPALLSTSREKVFEAVLDGLEWVVRDSTFIEQLIAACEGLGFLSAIQLTWLKHGLEHAHKGEWDQAMPPLIMGFEGAIFNGAVAAELIAAGRERKKLPAEVVIKAISLDEDLEKFAIRLVFGGSGNALRHGRPENAMRDQALPLLVALVGWLDFTLGTSGTPKLASELEESLASELGTARPSELATA